VPGQPENVSTATGQLIGYVIEVTASATRGRHWQALALDRAELGAHARRVDAEGAVFDDWVDGSPRRAPVAPEAATASGARA
jgi:hypothetical protein